MKLAFVFPGQGSQYVGMSKSLIEGSEAARRVFESASAAIGYDIAAMCVDGPAEELNRTEHTQPCLLTASVAAFAMLEEAGIRPSIAAGHSLGEYSALTACGAIGLEDAVRLVQYRGRIMQEAVPEGKGKMAAILGLERAEVDKACAAVQQGYVASANYNCPGQVVISGEAGAVERAMELSKEAGAKRALPLPVSVPSHSKLMDGAAELLRARLEEVEISAPLVPVVSNADAEGLTDPARIKDALVRQLNGPVLWEDCIGTIAGQGVDAFVEVGPKQVLAGLIRRIDKSLTVHSVEAPENLEALPPELKG